MKTILGLVLVLVGCGGAISGPPGSDGGSDGSPGKDAGGGPCPASPPANNGACSDNGLRCEYGSNPNPNCNGLFACMNGGWVNESTGSFCPAQSMCPSTFSAVPQGAMCSPNGLGCSYSEGTCFCTFGSGPVGMTARWDCIPATGQCPAPRPDIGDPCSSSGQMCDYGSCLGGVALQCTGGTWQEVNTTCPL